MKHVSTVVFISAMLMLAACGTARTDAPAGEQKRYDIRGTVISVDRAAGKAEIDHEEIPGFMPRMTMNFPIREEWVWEALTPGAHILAELVVDNTANEPYWLENISVTSAPDPNAPAPEVKEPDQIGKEVPAFNLTNQDGKKITFEDYRGKALGVTFIYRECPLPEYCIKMSQNFSKLALELNSDPELRDKVRLLTISFDPARDSPEKLREYGIGYLGNPSEPDFTVWQLAVGTEGEVRKVADFFGLQYEVDEKDKAQFNHSLVTAVIAPDGKVAKILPGSRWTTDHLRSELEAVLPN
jgi:protein SCO1